MADAVTTRTIYEDHKQIVVHLTSVSDGTGESAVVKVDKSAITTAVGGAEPTALDIERVDYAIQTFAKVTILWDHTTDDTALILAGTGFKDFTGLQNGILCDTVRTAGLQDPGSSGGAGDILLTSPATSGGTYDITLWLRKRV